MAAMLAAPRPKEFLTEIIFLKRCDCWFWFPESNIYLILCVTSFLCLVNGKLGKLGSALSPSLTKISKSCNFRAEKRIGMTLSRIDFGGSQLIFLMVSFFDEAWSPTAPRMVERDNVGKIVPSGDRSLILRKCHTYKAKPKHWEILGKQPIRNSLHRLCQSSLISGLEKSHFLQVD